MSWMKHDNHMEMPHIRRDTSLTGIGRGQVVMVPWTKETIREDIAIDIEATERSVQEDTHLHLWKS